MFHAALSGRGKQDKLMKREADKPNGIKLSLRNHHPKIPEKLLDLLICNSSLSANFHPIVVKTLVDVIGNAKTFQSFFLVNLLREDHF